MNNSWPNLSDLMTDGIAAQGRGIRILTGEAGAKLLNEAIDAEGRRFLINNLIDTTDWLLKKKIIESNQHENLVNMLNSPDHDNFELAKLLIQNYKNEYNIQRKRSQLQKPRFHR